MKVICPECERIILASDLNMFQMAAKCIPCDSVFDFTSQLDQEGNAARRGARQAIPEVTQPKKIRRLYDDEGVLNLRWRQDTGSRFLLVFLILFIGLPLVGNSFTIVFLVPPSQRPELRTIIEILPLIIGLFYGVHYFLFQLLNQITIRFTASELLVMNGPIPPKSKKRFSAKELTNIYVKQTDSKDFYGRPGYEIVAVDKLREVHEAIVSNLASRNEALYILQEIEHHFGLDNQQ